MTINIKQLDFHLLGCLEVLVAEHHVTKAAERLNMSQPRLSGALARLRKLTGDPLLIRGPEGMTPTPVAIDLARHFTEMSRKIQDTLSHGDHFRPEEHGTLYKISATDYFVATILSDLIGHLRRVAPRALVHVSTPWDGQFRETLGSDVDLAIVAGTQFPDSLFISKLFDLPLCCIAAADHPTIQGSLDLDQFVATPHALLSFGKTLAALPSEHMLDMELEKLGLRRSIALHVPTVLSIPKLIASTDLIATVPLELAETAAKILPLQVLPSPLGLKQIQISMAWHLRNNGDRGQRWLREQLRSLSRSPGQ